MNYPNKTRKQYLFWAERLGKSMKNREEGWVFGIKC